MTKKIKKYNIDELVMIGDYIHNCDTALIIAENSDATNRESDILVTMKGSKTALINILADMLNKNDEFREVVLVSVLAYHNNIKPKN